MFALAAMTYGIALYITGLNTNLDENNQFKFHKHNIILFVIGIIAMAYISYIAGINGL